jgi:hypothetical protein
MTKYTSLDRPRAGARVAIFRQKNYSAESGTRWNRRQFRQNSACFAEDKNLEIPLRTISRKKKTLGIPFRTIFGREKPWNSVPNHFRKRKNLGIPFWTILGREKPQNSVPNHFWKKNNFRILFWTNFWNRKHSKIRSKPFLGTETLEKDHFC